jgi:drug/metabolite transporter (DMT)-like permease
MLIPVLGVFSGSLWLGEVLHWQDWAAVLLMVASICSVLWPAAAPASSTESAAEPAAEASREEKST